MPEAGTKYCERCKGAFVCQPGNITACQCFGIELTGLALDHITTHFGDCLCRNCLLEINAEHEDA